MMKASWLVWTENFTTAFKSVLDYKKKSTNQLKTALMAKDRSTAQNGSKLAQNASKVEAVIA